MVLDLNTIENNIKKLGLHPERAKFLLACPIKGLNITLTESMKAEGGEAQIREASRLGMTFRDTAKMMEWSEDYLKAFSVKHSITFSKVSKHYMHPCGNAHSLFTD
jgi:hypothetical protein